MRTDKRTNNLEGFVCCHIFTYTLFIYNYQNNTLYNYGFYASDSYGYNEQVGYRYKNEKKKIYKKLIGWVYIDEWAWSRPAGACRTEILPVNANKFSSPAWSGHGQTYQGWPA